MQPRRPNTLTEGELRQTRPQWRCGEWSVQDLVSPTPDESRLAYNLVLTTIRILETKGYVEHRLAGRAFLYTTLIAEEDAPQTEVRHVIRRLLGDSRERPMLALLGEGQVSASELKALKWAIAEAEAGAKRNNREAR